MNRTAPYHPRSIKGVLFDFDGTLTSPGALDFPAIKSEMNCPLSMPILEFIEAQPAEKRPSLFEILEQREAEAAAESYPNAGAETCLLELKQRGISLGIHTRNSLRSVRQALLKFRGMRMEDFTAIMTRENSLPKPHPDGVVKASSKMSISPSDLMVVGDFRFDVMAGKAAGACSVLLTNGKKPVMEPGDPEPDYVITHLQELLNLI